MLFSQYFSDFWTSNYIFLFFARKKYNIDKLQHRSSKAYLSNPPILNSIENRLK